MSRFFTPEEAVELRLLGNGDYQKRDRLRLLKWAKYVYQDLNLSVVRKAVRRRYKINKRTNSIDLPCNNLQLSSVSIVHCGVEYPVYRSHRIFENSDIVDVGAAKDCGCEHNCSNTLCHTIKGYEAVVETISDYNPDGSEVSFECTSRKGVDDQGFLYEQKQYPKRVYEDGVWVSTILHTETNKLCSVEVDENGCVCDTEDNINNVCHHCGINNVNSNLCVIGGTANTPPFDGADTWIYHCNTKMEWLSGQFNPCAIAFNNIYNISELGDRLIFPSDFGWDSVIVRAYEDEKLSEMQIPIIAIDVFVLGLMFWDCRFNDKKQSLSVKYGRDYSNLSFGLFKMLNRYRLAELAQIVAPKVNVPTFIKSTTNKYEGKR